MYNINYFKNLKTMNDYKPIINLIGSEKFFLENLKKVPDKNRLKEWSRNLELKLKEEFQNYPVVYYIFKYREIEDNFEFDLNNALRTLEKIEEYFEKKSEDLPPHIEDLLSKILDLLKNSEEFDSKNLNIRDFEIWENEVGDFIEMHFIGAFSEDFQRITNSEYKGTVIEDGKEKIKEYIPVVWSHLANIRNILLEIMFELGKKNIKIIKNKKSIRSKMRCFLLDKPECSEIINLYEDWIFEAYDYSDEITEKAVNEINKVLSQFNLIPKPAKDYRRSKDFMCKICQMTQESKYFLADISGFNKNVILETGIAIGLSKKVFIISRDDPKEISDLERSEITIYTKDNLDKLKLDFMSLLKNELP